MIQVGVFLHVVLYVALIFAQSLSFYGIGNYKAQSFDYYNNSYDHVRHCQYVSSCYILIIRS